MRTGRRRGVALLLVLGLVLVLGAIGGVVVRGARGASALAENARAAVVARYAAESGIEALVAALQDTLSQLPFGGERRDWLNGLERGSGSGDTVVLGDGRFAWAVLDVSARLDVNAATQDALSAFLSQFTSPGSAAASARAIRDHVRGDANTGDRGAAGPEGGFRLAHPLRSLDELTERDLVPRDVFERAAPYLTVDGDGTINRRGASDTVLIAAAGELRDEPGRLLLITRGWMASHLLTHEIQAVFEIQVDRLVLVSWRERTL